MGKVAQFAGTKDYSKVCAPQKRERATYRGRPVRNIASNRPNPSWLNKKQMKSDDSIPRKSKASAKDSLLTEVSTSLTKARKAREEAFLRYDSDSDESVIEVQKVTVDKGDSPM